MNAERLTSSARLNKNDRIRVTQRSGITGDLSSEIYRVARTTQLAGCQRVWLVRSGSQPKPGRHGTSTDDWFPEAGFHFFDTNMLPEYEESITKRGGYERLAPELDWKGDATVDEAVALVSDGRYVVKRSYHEGKLTGYDVSYSLGMSDTFLIQHRTIPAAKQFALEDAITNGRIQ